MYEDHATLSGRGSVLRKGKPWDRSSPRRRTRPGSWTPACGGMTRRRPGRAAGAAARRGAPDRRTGFSFGTSGSSNCRSPRPTCVAGSWVEKATQAIMDGTSETPGVRKTNRFELHGGGGQNARRVRPPAIAARPSPKGWTRHKGAACLAILSERAMEEAKDMATPVRSARTRTGRKADEERAGHRSDSAIPRKGQGQTLVPKGVEKGARKRRMHAKVRIVLFGVSRASPVATLPRQRCVSPKMTDVRLCLIGLRPAQP